MVRKIFGIGLLLVGVSQFLMAGLPNGAPELDPATSVSAVVLLSGALLVIRSRRRKQ
jgi:hypothetical protein